MQSVLQKVIDYRENWILRIERLLDERVPKQVMKHQPRDTEPLDASGKMDGGQA
jgi:hypothetical protein